MNELKHKKGLILTEDDEKTAKIEGKSIEAMPIYKWLLKEAA